jgi:hypothetical protein
MCCACSRPVRRGVVGPRATACRVVAADGAVQSGRGAVCRGRGGTTETASRAACYACSHAHRRGAAVSSCWPEVRAFAVRRASWIGCCTAAVLASPLLDGPSAAPCARWLVYHTVHAVAPAARLVLTASPTVSSSRRRYGVRYMVCVTCPWRFVGFRWVLCSRPTVAAPLPLRRQDSVQPDPAVHWTCSFCTYALNLRATSTACDMCQQAMPAPTAQWACPMCTGLNPSSATKCQMCDTPRR